MLYDLQFEGSPILRAETSPVQLFDETLTEIVGTMFQTMRIYDGLGLAAPQINVQKQIIVMEFDPFVMINPMIIDSDGKQKIREGCLSFPGLFFDIERKSSVTVQWQDVTGKIEVRKFSKLEATVIQHEIDHLQGKLFVDYVGKMSVLLAKKNLRIK